MGGIVFSTLLSLGLIIVVTEMAESEVITSLAGTTGLLLLCVFAVVNVACVVLRRRPVRDIAFRAPKITPYIGAVACLFLAGPWARDSEDWVQYKIAGALLALGVVLWAITWLLNRATGTVETKFDDVDEISG